MKAVVRVWDAPTRVFHWALAICVVCLVVTAQIGGSAMMWHFRFGYAVLSLLCFRLVWGFVGGHWSRFGSFLYRPRQVWRYVQGRGEAMDSVGHNPMGAFSVFALLGFLSLQVGSGLFSDDEIAAAGPLVKFVSANWVGNATFYHKEVGKLILLVLVALHLVAIAAYLLKKGENLVRPMLTGDKLLDFPAPVSSDKTVDRVKAAAIILSCSALVYAAVTWAG
ncbi:MAG: cytochrome b/b6 domain-containing protein [Comamonadaceae bacterium]|nr:cytochrome b/b6 domain-containing protein [Comamonadaceae bacterium]